MFALQLRDLDGLAMIICGVLDLYLRINALWYQEFLLKALSGYFYLQKGTKYQHNAFRPKYVGFVLSSSLLFSLLFVRAQLSSATHQLGEAEISEIFLS